MNIYFLVEGKYTEKKVYPKWLSILVPGLQKVDFHDQVKQNNYYIFSGEGFPSLLDNHLRNTVEDVNLSGDFDYLVICLDSDDDTIQERRQQVLDFMQQEKIQLNSNTKFEIIVQNKCLETWFLGNSKLCKTNPNHQALIDCIKHYNVKEQDPELMEKPSDFELTTAQYHSKYLQEMMLERHIKYTKKNPNEVTEKYFLDELIQRNKTSQHIKSFKYFVDFCHNIHQQIIK